MVAMTGKPKTAQPRELTDADRDFIAIRKDAMRREAKYILAIKRLCEEVNVRKNM